MDISVKDIAKKQSKKPETGFEELYIAVRRHEKKVYTDDQLKALPDFDIHSHEWEIRKQSSGRLLTYLRKKHKHLNILEIGCGNGWLSAKMANIPNTNVTGLDINRTEISQARRVFKKTNLQFVYDDFNDIMFDKVRFDVIVLAASLQYFSSIVTVLQKALNILNRGGEIHIIDTLFYDPPEVGKAAGRCRDYYNDMGIPEMADHYFHHTISGFWGFNYRVLFNPGNILNRIFKKEPFYWIAIYK
ncbi:bifunctional 2-polyprenyl-6-hydroxyphenol methylase/3-demethylubiquinol 3-O-methyltransferase UbiG [Mucilaginibacter sp.]|uniref:class I SAM-dependent methyltransferase n=1 Tax=Mucilaginibacter sp. TaxID=1882438 RepID=UPI002616BD6E|nr:class I SAM-dependent methyltransferase [Mucilaginibacter sp.]MDB4925138.1 class SAM-dependent methyltransferase [Mucilaginibacter sp.]